MKNKAIKVLVLVLFASGISFYVWNQSSASRTNFNSEIVSGLSDTIIADSLALKTFNVDSAFIFSPVLSLHDQLKRDPTIDSLDQVYPGFFEFAKRTQQMRMWSSKSLHSTLPELDTDWIYKLFLKDSLGIEMTDSIKP